jgi:hypothetical protein
MNSKWRIAWKNSLEKLALGHALALAVTLPTAGGEINPKAAPISEVKLRDNSAPAGLVWIEGEDAEKSTATRHGWYDDVRKDELSGGRWLSHFGANAAEASYKAEFAVAGEYHFWIRANPVAGPKMDYRIGENDWVPVDFSKSVQQINIATDGKADMRFVAWINLGKVKLGAGSQTAINRKACWRWTPTNRSPAWTFSTG